MSSKSEEIKIILDWIKECADYLGIHPYQVQYNQLQKYASENDETIDNAYAARIKALGGFTNIRDAAFRPVLETKSLETKVLAKDNRALAKADAVERIYLDRFKEICKEIFKKPLIIGKVAAPRAKSIERNLHLCISDTHFGAVLKPQEGLTKFDIEEPARRLAKLAIETAEYKPQYRKCTKLFVNLNGDIIQGNIHDAFAAKRMAEQKAMALWMFRQFLAYLSTQYSSIEVNCTTGNHDRYADKNPDRVVAEKWDSHATDIYYALKIALMEFKNIKINIPLTPWADYKSFGVNYRTTHGDNVFKIGNPGSSINVKNLENEVNKLNATRDDLNKIKVVILGHVHTGLHIRLKNGVAVITNPPLIPADSYANSIGIYEAPTGQWLIESVQGYPVGDSRLLMVDETVDKDTSLDKIVQPWPGF